MVIGVCSGGGMLRRCKKSSNMSQRQVQRLREATGALGYHIKGRQCETVSKTMSPGSKRGMTDAGLQPQ